ncbi:hypothetical protein SOPP22_12140 [Shewanella sp. OPT22]|nr:hypothetical protein SOPP22_12140 [Shewanella sp. OPT22]
MGRSNDIELSWLTEEYGTAWETWRELASTWLTQKNHGVSHSLTSVCCFIERFLVPRLLTDPVEFFVTSNESTFKEFLLSLELSESYRVRLNNETTKFIEWLLIEYYSEPDDNGELKRLFKNPLEVESAPKSRLETVYNALPYAYIKQLRNILCPKQARDFKDWIWPIEQSASIDETLRHCKDWMLVDESQIDKTDPDCIWKEIVLTKARSIRINGVLQRKPIGSKLYFIWSPVKAVALLIKLLLPLRTFQVRMLDSGEADTWRYVNGSWEHNTTHSFAQGSEQRPWRKGVFCRIRTPDIGDVMTGLYINTNKTADRNKDEISRGYVIPWQYEEALYWLEKLRNWQEKYNAIAKPTSIQSITRRHFGTYKTVVQKEEIGDICFLFRNASATIDDDKNAPITDSYVNKLWYALLSEFEEQLFKEGAKLPDGRKIPLIDGDKTLFPLHSLRVSLITCYAVEGEIPAPVLSKLLAGHSRLIMTMHYTKITPAVMARKMKKAEDKINQNEEGSLKSFLADSSLQQIEQKSVFRELSSVETVIRSKNIAGWQERAIGVCLVGGNTSKDETNTSLAGCWNGGYKLKKANANQADLYGSVEHGFENCVRCRWFITDIRYIHALTSHLNNISFQSTEAAKRATELEAQKELLLDEKYFYEANEQVFTKDSELTSIDRRLEKFQTEADEWCKDLIACFQIIRRLLKLEEKREGEDSQQKVVALGGVDDISEFISFTESDSELHQLSQVCFDAEIYPDLRDSLFSTPAIERRSKSLNKLLMNNGLSPIFMNFNDEMQLIAGNAMIRAMLKKSESVNDQNVLRKITEEIENLSFNDSKLIDLGVKAIEDISKMPVFRLNQIPKKLGRSDK